MNPADQPRIGRLTPTDASAYRALMLEAYASAPEAFSSSPVDRQDLPLAWWASRLDHPRCPGLVWGAWHGGDLVGSVALDWPEQVKTRHKGHLYGVYVTSTWRRRGLARALLDAALAPKALPPHLGSVCLTVTVGNTAAQRLYESLGFKVWGLEPDALRPGDGRRLAKVHMRLVLG